MMSHWIYRTRSLVPLAALVLLLCGSGLAHGQKVPGKAVAKNTSRVLDKIDWQVDFDIALAKAKEDQKPLLWLQTVGDLGGGL